jgi:hypothetical protein
VRFGGHGRPCSCPRRCAVRAVEAPGSSAVGWGAAVDFDVVAYECAGSDSCTEPAQYEDSQPVGTPPLHGDAPRHQHPQQPHGPWSAPAVVLAGEVAQLEARAR